MNRKEIEMLAGEIRGRVDTLPEHTTEKIRDLRREFSRRLKGLDAEEMIALADRLIDLGRFDLRFVGYELVSHHREAAAALDADHLERLGRGMASWQEVDTFSPYLSGPAWRKGQIPTSLIESWARSDDRWWRRAAVVSTVPLNNRARGGSGDASRTLHICAMLIDDRDDMVVKAISWALRELAKRDPESVRGFMEEHRDRAASRVIREVRNKLETGLKTPRR